MGCSNCSNMFGEENREMDYEKESKHYNKDFFSVIEPVKNPSKDSTSLKTNSKFFPFQNKTSNSQRMSSQNNNNNKIKNDIFFSTNNQRQNESAKNSFSKLAPKPNAISSMNEKDLELSQDNPSNLQQIKTIEKYKKIINLDNDNEELENDDYENQIAVNDGQEFSPIDDYSKYIFDKINEVRQNPQFLIPLIKEAKNYIKSDNQGHVFFKRDKTKIFLNRGEQAFDETISFLSECQPMPKLKFFPNIVVNPPEEEYDLHDNEYIKKEVKMIESSGYKVKSFWKERSKNPEIAFLFMIIDDNSKNNPLKRIDILDEKMKYIGISSATIEKSFGCYITLSKGGR